MKMSESQLQAAVIELALRTRWLVFHDYDSRCNLAGFPDLILCHQYTGKVLFCELKAGTGKLRPDQIRWQNALSQCEANHYRLWLPMHWTSGEIEEELVREYVDAH